MPSYHLDIIVDGQDNASSVLHGLSGALAGVSKAFAGVAAAAAAGLGVAFGKAMSQATEFESQLSGIRAVSGATAADMNALSEAALRIGKDTSFGASDAAAAMEMLAKNGLNVSQILGGATDATIALAAATGLKGQSGLSQAADIATDAMAIFGISAAEMSKAVNGISGVTVASKFSIEDYALALAQGGGVAAAVGVEFEDFNTVIAGISPLFASGSDAGTSLKTMLQRLIPASKDAAGAMASLGLITYDTNEIAKTLAATGLKSTGDAFGDLNNLALHFANGDGEKASKMLSQWAKEGAYMKNEFFDANGALKDMDQIAGLLQRSMAGLSEEQTNEALSTIFGTDAMRAAVGIAKLGEQGFNDLAASIGKVDAAEQAAIRLDNLSGDLEQLYGSLETVAIQLGTAFIPLMRDLTQAASAFIDTHLVDRDWSPLVSGVTAAASWIGELAERIGRMIQVATMEGGGLRYLFVTFEDGTNYIGAVVKMFGIAESTAYAFGTAVGTLAQVAMAAFTSIVQAISNPQQALQSLLQAFTNSLALTGTFVLGIVNSVISATPSLLSAFGQWASSVLSWLGPQIPILLAQGMEMRNQLIGFVLASTPNLINSLGTWALAFLGWLQTALPNLLNIFTTGTIQLIGLIGQHLPAIIAALGKWSLALVAWVVDALPGLLANLWENVAKLLDAIGQALPGIIEALARWAGAFIEWLVDAAPKLLAELGGLLVTIIAWLAERLPTIISTLGGWALAFIEWVLPVAGRLLVNLGQLLADLVVWLVASAPAIGAKLAEWATMFGAWVTEKAIPYLQEKLPQVLGSIWGWISDTATKIGADGSVGRALVDGIKNGISAAWGTLTNLATNIGMSIRDKIAEWVGAFQQVGRDLVGGMWQGISDRWGGLLNNLTGGLQSLPDAAKNFLGIHSPSTVFADIGRWIWPGLAQGAEQSLPSVQADLGQQAAELMPAITMPSLTLPTLPSSAATNSTAPAGLTVIVQVAGNVATEDDLATSLIDKLRVLTARNGGLNAMGVSL